VPDWARKDALHAVNPMIFVISFFDAHHWSVKRINP
jgi:hypothetical protein